MHAVILAKYKAASVLISFLLFQISVCKMRKSRHGIFSRYGSAVEVVADRSDTYSQLAKKACEVLDVSGNSFSLYSLGGAVIVNERGWTLGGYMRKIRRSPSELKIGIGERSVSEVCICMQPVWSRQYCIILVYKFN